MEAFVCVLCGQYVREYGNNPAPLAAVGKCCDKCNAERVIPARMRRAALAELRAYTLPADAPGAWIRRAIDAEG